MVPGVGLEIVSVSEAGGVGMSEPEWPVGVAVVNSVDFLSVDVFKNVILNDGGLTHGSNLSASSFT